jgi:hypothetical protein
LGPLPPGGYTIRASNLGYRSEDFEIRVGGGEPLTVSFELSPRPVELSGITVSLLRPDMQPESRQALMVIGPLDMMALYQKTLKILDAIAPMYKTDVQQWLVWVQLFSHTIWLVMVSLLNWGGDMSILKP